MTKRSRTAGFAVMELLVAMALLGVIATFIAGSLAFGNRVWERANAVSDNGRRIAEIAFLRNTLTQAITLPKVGGDTEPPAFNGQIDNIQVVTLRTAPGYAADQPWMISVSKVPRDPKLIVGFAPLFQGRVEQQEQHLLERLDAMAIRYYGRLLDEDQPRWQQQWEKQPHLPDLIEITLTFDDGGQRSSRLLSIRPRAH